jgi:hypothetical protein
MYRFLSVLPCVLMLSACMSDDTRRPNMALAQPTDDMATGAIRSAVPEQALPGTAAIVELPAGAGMADQVRERIYGNGAYQQIRLDGPAPHGANIIEAAVQTDATPVRRDLAVPLAKPSEGGIRSEILARFPDLRMQIVGKPMENGFGPFGLAIGRYADGTRCIYAWQWIDDFRETSRGQSSFSRLADAWSKKSGTPASVRIRICRPDSSVDELASFVQGLNMGDAGNLERVRSARNIVDPTIISSSVGRDSGPVVVGGTYGAADGSLESALGPEVTRQPARPASAPRAIARAPQAAPAKHVAARRAPAAPVEKMVRAKAPAKSATKPDDGSITPYSGPYLAPVAGAGGVPMIAPQPGLAAPAYRSSALDAGLPPQAYRGPTASYDANAGGSRSPYTR